MPRSEEIRQSILIVSASEQFDAVVRRSLRGYMSAEFRKSAAAARRCLLERPYDLVVINLPLADEPGTQFARDIAAQYPASVLLVTPPEDYDSVLEQVTDHGILVISRSFPRTRLNQAIRYLTAIRNRMRRLEARLQTVQDKMEELRVVSRAKILLVERKHMTEDDAHRYIGKQAMNNGISRKRAAERVLEDLE